MNNQAPAKNTCKICLFAFEKSVLLKTCKHRFCESCTIRIASSPKHECPQCGIEFQLTDMIIQAKLPEQQNQAKRKGEEFVWKYRFEMSSYSQRLPNGQHRWGFCITPLKGQAPLKMLFEKVQLEVKTKEDPQVYTFDTTEAIMLSRLDKDAFSMKIRLYYHYEKKKMFECLFLVPIGENNSAIETVMKKKE